MPLKFSSIAPAPTQPNKASPLLGNEETPGSMWQQRVRYKPAKPEDVEKYREKVKQESRCVIL